MNSSARNDSFWTDQQLDVLDSMPWTLHIVVGIVLVLVSLFGFAANTVILIVYSRFRRLRTPANTFIINVTVSDLGACLFHPMAAYSALVEGRWAFGQTGCDVYAMGVGFFGLNTIVTLAAVAYERYVVITAQPMSSGKRITRRQAQKMCAVIWIYCFALTAPPSMCGWSKYGPEGVLVTCSWDYTTRTLSNRLYYVYLLVFGFVVPVAVLVYCYANILRYISQHGREMNTLRMTTSKKRNQTDVRTAKIILALSFLYFVAWTPYAIVSFIGQFGADDEPLSPMASAIPAFFAKTAVVFDPLVYGFSHPLFRSSIRQLVLNPSETSGNGLGPNRFNGHGAAPDTVLTGRTLHPQQLPAPSNSAHRTSRRESQRQQTPLGRRASSSNGQLSPGNANHKEWHQRRSLIRRHGANAANKRNIIASLTDEQSLSVTNEIHLCHYRPLRSTKKCERIERMTHHVASEPDLFASRANCVDVPNSKWIVKKKRRPNNPMRNAVSECPTSSNSFPFSCHSKQFAARLTDGGVIGSALSSAESVSSYDTVAISRL